MAVKMSKTEKWVREIALALSKNKVEDVVALHLVYDEWMRKKCPKEKYNYWLEKNNISQDEYKTYRFESDLRILDKQNPKVVIDDEDWFYPMTEEQENTASIFIYQHKRERWRNVENPLKNCAPAKMGIYLIGTVSFNPFTKEELYFIKVGFSGNLQRRMKDYRTSSPTIFHIAYDTEDSILESDCHSILRRCAECQVEGTDEWFKVSKEMYFEICEKKFEFFTK